MEPSKCYTRALITQISEHTGISRAEIRLVLKAIVEAISANLAAGREVIITNLGRFKITQIKPRQIISMTNRESVDVDSTNVVRFKASNNLKQRV